MAPTKIGDLRKVIAGAIGRLKHTMETLGEALTNDGRIDNNELKKILKALFTAERARTILDDEDHPHTGDPSPADKSLVSVALDEIATGEAVIVEAAKKPLPTAAATTTTSVSTTSPEPMSEPTHTAAPIKGPGFKSRVRDFKSRVRDFFRKIGTGISHFVSGVLPRLAAMGVFGMLGLMAGVVMIVWLLASLLGNVGKPWHGTFSSSVSASGSSSSFTRGIGKKAEDVFVDNAVAQRKMAVLEQENSHKMSLRDQDQEDTAEAHRFAWMMELIKGGKSIITLYNPAGRQTPLTVTILGKSYSIEPGHTTEIEAPLGDHRGVKNGRTATFPVTPPSARTATDGAVIVTGCLCDDSPMP